MQAAGILPGDTVLFEKVPDDEVQDGEMVCVTLLDEHEDGAYLVKYLQWARNGEDKVILTAEDGTRIGAPYERVIIEGRYWDLQRPRNHQRASFRPAQNEPTTRRAADGQPSSRGLSQCAR